MQSHYTDNVATSSATCSATTYSQRRSYKSHMIYGASFLITFSIKSSEHDMTSRVAIFTTVDYQGWAETPANCIALTVHGYYNWYIS